MSAFDAVRRQADIYLSRVQRGPKQIPTAPARLEEAARSRLSGRAFGYLAGGAGTEDTAAENRRAFAGVRIVPELLHDVGSRDLGIALFGRRLPAPIFLAPIGVLELAHRHGDLAVSVAAGALGIPLTFSSQASHPMEDCAALLGSSPRWFQLYWSRSDAVVRSFCDRAKACGCEAIVVTLDTTLLGWRPRDLDYHYLPFLFGRGIAQYTSDPSFLNLLSESLNQSPAENTGSADKDADKDADKHAGEAGARVRISATAISILLSAARRFPGRFLQNVRSPAPRRAIQQFISIYSRPSITWRDLAFLRSITDLPIVLKGILSRADAARAVENGVDAVYVSNHGGRQIDGEIGSLDALGPVVDSVAGRIPVLFDSGVRTGSDIFKALALGADAVGIGRPYAYGLALAGAAGVEQGLRNLIAELELTMALSGCRSIAEIDRSRLRLRQP